jgi:glutamate racemase
LQPHPHVLVFDSGIGGLSVLAEIRTLSPSVRLTYAADNAAFPYGLKTEPALIARVTAVIARLIAEASPDLLVIACNTASTSALAAVREFLTIPVIGVVPAVKPAAAATRSGTIGLLGTNATVASSYTGALIAEFASHRRVLTAGAPELVEAAEFKLQGAPVDPAAIRAALDRLFGAVGGEAIDTVVLGCTHFPLLIPELRAAAPHPVAWMDSGAAIARRVAATLRIDPANSGPPPRHRALFTRPTGAVERMRPGLARFGLEEIGFVEVAGA